MIQAEWLLLGSKTATIYLRAGYVRHRLRKHLNDLKCTNLIYTLKELYVFTQIYVEMYPVSLSRFGVRC